MDSLRAAEWPLLSWIASLSAEDRRQAAYGFAAWRQIASAFCLARSGWWVVGRAAAFQDLLRDAGVRTFAIDERTCINAIEGHRFPPGIPPDGEP